MHFTAGFGIRQQMSTMTATATRLHLTSQARTHRRTKQTHGAHRLTAVSRQKTRLVGPGHAAQGAGDRSMGPAARGAGASTWRGAGKNRLNAGIHTLWEDGQTKVPRESTV